MVAMAGPFSHPGEGPSESKSDSLERVVGAVSPRSPADEQCDFRTEPSRGSAYDAVALPTSLEMPIRKPTSYQLPLLGLPRR